MATIEDFVEAGLYNPLEHATNGRLELLEWLDGRGFTIAEMVDALEHDTLGALAGDRRLMPGDRVSRARAMEQSGLDSDTFDRYVTAFGFVPIDGEDDVTLTSDEIDTISLIDALSTMFSPDEALAFVRVVGSSVARISEAGVSLFLAEIEAPMLSADGSEMELAQSIFDAIGLLDGFSERLDPILRRHVFQAVLRSRQSLIDQRERVVYRYAIGFVDLVGFTERSERMNASELAGFIRDFEGRAHETLNDVGARLVKLIGDEVMFVATDASAACRAASALMSGFGHTGDQVLPRGGLAYGHVLVRGGDYYGAVVNLASRLVDEAVPGEVLVTDGLAAAATECHFEPAGRRMVKGFAEAVRVQSLRTD